MIASILIRVAILAWFLQATVYAEKYSVLIPTIPRPVTITVPEHFSPPQTAVARERRERLLDFYRLNPSVKGIHSEVLLKDWTPPSRRPAIVVGALGSTAKHQGQITKAQWLEVRGMFLKSSSAEIQKIRERIRPKIESSSPVATHTDKELVWMDEQKDPYSVIILAMIRAETDGERVEEFSARKLMFKDGFLVCIDVMVDASRPEALSEIKGYCESIAIVDI